MEELKIDWNQERPNLLDITKIWDSIKFSRLENWTSSTKLLKETIFETHSIGGIQLHRYKISSDKNFDWFAQRNRLDEIEFLKNVFRHKDLENYRNDLEIKNENIEVKNIKFWTDIYDTPALLARAMGYGGAYEKIDHRLAWKIATDFINDEFENRFEEFICYSFVINEAQWFWNIAWDNSILLFDKRKSEITIIDITDSD